MKRKVCLILIIVLLISAIGIIIGTKVYNGRKEKNLKIARENQQKEISSHYNTYVKTNKESKIYIKENNKYIEYGVIGKDIELTLEALDITYDTKYFYITDLKCFIPYENVEKLQDLTPVNESNYKKYVIFNENIVTDKETSFYNEKGLVYKINKGMSLPIIIKDTDKYYVEYNNLLLYVKKNEVTTKKSNNNTTSIRNDIRTLTYHTIYEEGKQECTNTVICHPISQFDSHMKYLSENNYLTLTMNELEMFLDGKIRIPTKSIVITLDDGKYHTNAVNIVEKYKVHATYFIITSVYDVSKTKSEYMEFQSHTHDMHNNWKCPGGNQGGQFLCENKEKALKDLKTSQEKLGGSFALAYPYFDFNDRAIKLLKEANFRLAFIGQYDSDGYSNPNTNRFMLRRKTIFSDNSVEILKNYLK